jgi:hypothetical protein
LLLLNKRRKRHNNAKVEVPSIGLDLLSPDSVRKFAAEVGPDPECDTVAPISNVIYLGHNIMEGTMPGPRSTPTSLSCTSWSTMPALGS